MNARFNVAGENDYERCWAGKYSIVAVETEFEEEPECPSVATENMGVTINLAGLFDGVFAN
jgi:hypothetical protein